MVVRTTPSLRWPHQAGSLDTTGLSQVAPGPQSKAGPCPRRLRQAAVQSAKPHSFIQLTLLIKGRLCASQELSWVQ